MDPLINRQLGNYCLQQKLGAGACGVVYKAEHRKLGTPFAVKILHPVLGSSKESSERFLREARTAARIAHENVVFIADFDVEPGIGPYFVMEYLDGESLRQGLDREAPFHAEKVAVLSEQICHALAAAHRLGVVHRDLKPDNIMIVPRPGRQLVKILDFGIAKITLPEETERINLTQSGHILGTPRYFSPEQAQGQHIDHRSDIYSFGIILYEMLTGQTPFQGRNPEEMRHHHIYTPPPPLGPAFPNELQDLLDWLLSKHVDERPDDMEEVWSLLKEALPLIKRASIPREETRETQRLPGLQAVLDTKPAPTISRTSGYQEDSAMAAVRNLEPRNNRTISLGVPEHALPDANLFPPEPTAPQIRLQEQNALDDEHTLHESMLPQNSRNAQDDEHEGPTLFDPAARLRKLLLASTQTSDSNQNTDGTDEISLPNAGDDDEEGATMISPLHNQNDANSPPSAPRKKTTTPLSSQRLSEDIGVEVHTSALDAEDTAMHPTASQRFSDFSNAAPSRSTDLSNAAPPRSTDLSNAAPPRSTDLSNAAPPHSTDLSNASSPRFSELPTANDDDLPTTIARPTSLEEHTLHPYKTPAYSDTEPVRTHNPPPARSHTLERRSPKPPPPASFAEDARPTQDTLEAVTSASPSIQTATSSSAPPAAHVDALLGADALLLNDTLWKGGWFQRWQALDPLPRFSSLAGIILFVALFGWFLLGLLSPTPTRMCEILLKTSPQNAEIWLGDTLIGRTPYTLRRPCLAQLSLSFRKPNYAPHKQDLLLREDSSEIDLPLRPQPNHEYTLTLSTIPSEAAVYTEEGTLVCHTPCSLKAPLGSTRSYEVKKHLRRRRNQRWSSQRVTLQFAPPHKTHTLRLR